MAPVGARKQIKKYKDKGNGLCGQETWLSEGTKTLNLKSMNYFFIVKRQEHLFSFRHAKSKPSFLPKPLLIYFKTTLYADNAGYRYISFIEKCMRESLYCF